MTHKSEISSVHYFFCYCVQIHVETQAEGQRKESIAGLRCQWMWQHNCRPRGRADQLVCMARTERIHRKSPRLWNLKTCSWLTCSSKTPPSRVLQPFQLATLAVEPEFKQKSLWEIYYILITTSDLPIFPANNPLIYLVGFFFAHFLVMYVLYLRTNVCLVQRLGERNCALNLFVTCLHMTLLSSFLWESLFQEDLMHLFFFYLIQDSMLWADSFLGFLRSFWKAPRYALGIAFPTSLVFLFSFLFSFIFLLFSAQTF